MAKTNQTIQCPRGRGVIMGRIESTNFRTVGKCTTADTLQQGSVALSGYASSSRGRGGSWVCSTAVARWTSKSLQFVSINNDSNISFMVTIHMWIHLRYMHNCPQCFWALHQGHGWEQAISVAASKRVGICEQVGLKHRRVADEYKGERLVGLGHPSDISCKSVLGQGGGECWFSAIYFLLVGQKAVVFNLNVAFKRKQDDVGWSFQIRKRTQAS